MKQFFLFIAFVVSLQYSFSQENTFSKFRSLFSPPPKVVKPIAPKLDTAQVLLIDSSETFFQRHYSVELDESGLESTNDEEELYQLESEEDEEGDSEDSTSQFYIPNESEWIKIDTLFKIFNPYSVNPYKFDPLKIKDTVRLKMFDSTRKWSMPLDSLHTTTSKFGPRGYSYHYGTDIRLDIGDTVRSVFDGIVRISKYNPGGYGNYVLVRHYNGTETIYGHLSERKVVIGQEVKAGQMIGLGGNTGRSSGPHLHFEVRYKGIALNPQTFFDFENNKIISNVYNLSPKDFQYIKVQRSKIYYKVRSGDTLYGIARKYHVKYSQICKLNHITTKSVLRVGQTLRIR